ncbi:hypothetical protein ACFL3S_09755 [Gemmatimonadota bacterium]
MAVWSRPVPLTPLEALELGLSAYDAAYLWLARELNVELVSLDARLDAGDTAP